MKIAICVAFYFRNDRLVFLKKTCSDFHALAPSVNLTIVTNASNDSDLGCIRDSLQFLDIKYEIYSASDLGHPLLLPWSHFTVFRRLLTDQSFSHFLYVEDDIYVCQKNIEYWINAEEALRSHGLIPSFLRYEFQSGKDSKYCTDLSAPVFVWRRPRLILTPRKAFLNMPSPYQAMYFLDRKRMKEHLEGPTSSPDFPIAWNIREKAAQGLSWSEIPKGFFSRSVVGYDPTSHQIDEGALVHHLPNNYANNPNTGWGKIEVKHTLTSYDCRWHIKRFAERIGRRVSRRPAVFTKR
jgi:hypothetical protein